MNYIISLHIFLATLLFAFLFLFIRLAKFACSELYDGITLMDIFGNIPPITMSGWTGKVRISGIHIFAIESESWLKPALKEPELSGFAVGAGLSGHAVLELVSNSSSDSVSAMVLGREGSLRMQRKQNSIYLLQGRINPTGQSKFVYTEITSQVPFLSSRSHFTANPLGSTKLCIVGGRKDQPIEVMTLRRSSDTASKKTSNTLVFRFGKNCHKVRKVINQLERDQSMFTEKQQPPITSFLRGHIAVPSDNGLFISCGEGFINVKKEALSTAYALVVDKKSASYKLGSIGRINHPRAYAVGDVHEASGTAYLHGGIDRRGEISGHLLKLVEDTVPAKE